MTQFNKRAVLALACFGLCACAMQAQPGDTAAEGSHGVSKIPACKWARETTVVVPATATEKQRKAIDSALDALVKALGAAAPEVAAVKKAIDTLGPGGDLVTVYVICACTDGTGKVVMRRKVQVASDDEIHWAGKTNLLHGKAKEENDKEREKIEKKCCTLPQPK